MKMIISFIAGVTVCVIMLYGVRTMLPAASANTLDKTGSDNATLSLSTLMPDFQKIYRQSLAEPFIKAGADITDPGIANFYNGLMQKTGLTHAADNVTY